MSVRLALAVALLALAGQWLLWPWLAPFAGFLFFPAVFFSAYLAYVGGRASERRRAAAQLRQSEIRFEATFEQAAVGIALVAPDGRWLRANQKLCEIVGYAHDELLAKTFHDITHADDVDADLAQMRQMLAGEISTYALEKRCRRKDGGVVWVNLTVALVRRAD
ncbi:MAG: PAS domain S-box protein, partial [Candidatus Methylumidiphilus sp.]